MKSGFCGCAIIFQKQSTARFNINKFYIVITWNLCVLYGSENKQQILYYTTLKVVVYD